MATCASLSVEVHPIRNPGVPTHHQQTDDHQGSENDEAEVDPPASVVAQAVSEMQSTHPRDIGECSRGHIRPLFRCGSMINPRRRRIAILSRLRRRHPYYFRRDAIRSFRDQWSPTGIPLYRRLQCYPDWRRIPLYISDPGLRRTRTTQILPMKGSSTSRRAEKLTLQILQPLTRGQNYWLSTPTSNRPY